MSITSTNGNAGGVIVSPSSSSGIMAAASDAFSYLKPVEMQMTPPTSTATTATPTSTSTAAAGAASPTSSTSSSGGPEAFPVFRNQVAGHAPLLWHKGTICKPLNPTEYYFYSQLMQGELSALGPFTPKFYGILDMSFIPIEFQKQAAEKTARKEVKKLALLEQERRELKAKAQQVAAQANIPTAVDSAASSSTSTTTDGSLVSSSTISLTLSTPGQLHIESTTSTLVTQSMPPQSLLSSSQSIPLSLSSAATPSTSNAASTVSASASPTNVPQPAHLNTWVYACQQRKLEKGAKARHNTEMLGLGNNPAAATSLADDKQHAHTLPASFQLSTSSSSPQTASASTTGASTPIGAAADSTTPAPSTAAAVTAAAAVDSLPQYIVLEDLTFAYDRPCILDIKLGTRQHGINDSAKKIASKLSKCMKTTSGKLGIRLCGMQVYHPKNAKTGSNSGSTGDAQGTPQQQTDGKFIYYDKYYGRSLTEDTFLKTLKLFFWNGEKLLLHIILLFLERLDKLRQTLELREMSPYRFYSSSLLMVYEGQSSVMDLPPPVPSGPRPAHYPTLNLLNSSNRVHDIVDRTFGMSRSQSFDFHDVHHTQSLEETIRDGTSSSQTNETASARLPTASPVQIRPPSAASPPPGSSSGSTPQVPHLDAEDILELEQILAREVERIATIRHSYPPILAQKIVEEKQESEKRRKMLEDCALQAAAKAQLSDTATVSVGLSVQSTPAAGTSPSSLPPSASATSDTPIASATPSGLTPAGTFSPTDHISYVHVISSSVDPSTGTATQTTTTTTRRELDVTHASPQPPSPQPIPAVDDRPAAAAATTTPIVTTSDAVPSQAPLSRSPPPPSISPSFANAPKFYNRPRKTTHAMARERARLKGNIDIRLIDYAQVVKYEHGAERAILDAALNPSPPSPEGSQSSRSSVGDPGLLIGVNNLIYFISNIVQQEVQLLLSQERMRNENGATPTMHNYPSNTARSEATSTMESISESTTPQPSSHTTISSSQPAPKLNKGIVQM